MEHSDRPLEGEEPGQKADVGNRPPGERAGVRGSPVLIEPLTGGRRLARNSLLSLVSQAFPLGVTLLALPVLMARLGSERFGVLAFVWSVFAFVGVSDLGVGYVTTRLVAARLGARDEQEVPTIFWTCSALLLAIGVAVAIALLACVPWLAESGLSVGPAYQDETARSLAIVGIGVPVSILGSGCRGLLEAYQRFGWRNVVVVINSLLMVLAPLVASAATRRVDVIAGSLVAARALMLAISWTACVTTVPALRKRIRFSGCVVRQAISLGGWMTVVNILGPLFQYGDRFVIGGLVSLAAVGYYFVPYELATRLLMVVGSMTVVLMPALAATIDVDRMRAWRLFSVGLKLGIVSVFLMTFAVAGAAQLGLSLWLGNMLAGDSTATLRIILVGVVFNAAGVVALSFILGAGRPQTAAKLQILELLIYFPLAWSLVGALGIRGAAIAYAGRMAFDSLLLLWKAHDHRPPAGARHHTTAGFLVSGAILVGGWLLSLPLPARVAYGVIVPVAFSLSAWWGLFSAGERAVVSGALRPAVLGLSRLANAPSSRQVAP